MSLRSAMKDLKARKEAAAKAARLARLARLSRPPPGIAELARGPDHNLGGFSIRGRSGPTLDKHLARLAARYEPAPFRLTPEPVQPNPDMGKRVAMRAAHQGDVGKRGRIVEPADFLGPPGANDVCVLWDGARQPRYIDRRALVTSSGVEPLADESGRKV